MSEAYDDYLNGHVVTVNNAANWMIANLEAVAKLSDAEFCAFRKNARWHDSSKFLEEEYDAYDAYFYGDRDEDAFNRAWLHHIHNNPHHWQHWLLMNDDGKYRDLGKVVPIEMPKVYALEMIADWWSFSWRSGNLHEVFDWYESHKDHIILHEKTRAYVEAVLDEIKGKLGEGQCTTARETQSGGCSASTSGSGLATSTATR